MKTFIFLVALTVILTPAAQAKIVVQGKKFFVESKGSRKPIALLNALAESKEISEVKLFGDGKVNLVGFAKGKEKELLYSVDEDGYIYSIKPFTNYEVKKVEKDGLVQFKQDPKRKYRINSKGFFLY